MAAAQLGTVLKPQQSLLYLQPEAMRLGLAQLIRTQGLRSDPEGDVEVVEAFWSNERLGLSGATVPVPLVIADLLASLPVVQHTDLLREAGSVAFLEEVAKRGYPPPRRPPPAQSQADVRADMQEFDGKIAALQTAETEGNSRETLAARREFVLQLADPTCKVS